MFHVPVEKHGQNKELRQKGKIAVLALGYGGAVNALDAMGGKRMGMSEEDEKETVNKWRKANPHIVAFWKDVENAVRRTVAFKVRSTVRGIEFNLHDDTLCCVLPSGRTICYPEMRIVYDNDWAYLDQTDAQRATNPNYIVREKKTLHPDKYWDEPGSRLAYKGVVQTTNKWSWIDTFGGKLVENITQAVARDCLAHAMLLVMHENIPIVFHVHDELVCEVPDESYLEKIEKCFSKAPDWAQGLPLKGAGYVTPFYKKD
jgi:DNA polymerase